MGTRFILFLQYAVHKRHNTPIQDKDLNNDRKTTSNKENIHKQSYRKSMEKVSKSDDGILHRSDIDRFDYKSIKKDRRRKNGPESSIGLPNISVNQKTVQPDTVDTPRGKRVVPDNPPNSPTKPVSRSRSKVSDSDIMNVNYVNEDYLVEENEIASPEGIQLDFHDSPTPRLPSPPQKQEQSHKQKRPKRTRKRLEQSSDSFEVRLGYHLKFLLV